MRTVNDTYKLQILALADESGSYEQMSLMQSSPNEDVRLHADGILEPVFSIFGRLSLAEESEEMRFPLH
jgi:hypothetical protein